MSKLTLNNDQQNAVSGIVNGYLKEGQKIFSIQGDGGTGKTTVIQHILEELNIPLSNVLLTAPTHEAVEVARESFGNVDIATKTIYSLLRLRVADDVEERYAVPYADIDLGNYLVILCDEISMWGGAIFSRFKAAVENFPNVVWILLGDSYQLKPVKSTNKIFDWLKETDKPVFTLKENMRMHKDSPILKTITQLKNAQDHNYRGRIHFTQEETEHGSMFTVNVREFNEQFVDTISKYKNNKEFTSDVVALAYTNVRVNALNRLAREEVYGKDAQAFYIGERVMTNNPIKENQAGEEVTIANTNSKGIVTDIGEECYSPSYKTRGYEIWSIPITVDFKHAKYGIASVLVHVPVGEGKAEYDRMVKKELNIARKISSPKGWFSYFKFIESEPEIRYTYAMTVHKAQGRTFNKWVYLDAYNIINKCPNNDDILHLLNVGLSRTRKDVTIAQTTTG